MKQFKVLLYKEFLEAWRSFKFLWIPLVFILLGVSDPVMNYFMEDIMGAVGNLPEGFEITLPELSPPDLIAATTGQFQSVGIIVLVAIAASTISKERQNGTATLIYVRPVSSAAIYLSKYTVLVGIALVSMLAGYAGSLYYTNLLYGAVEWGDLFKLLCLYALWVLFACAVAITASALFKTAVAMTISIIVIPIGLIIDTLIGGFWTITPWKLANYGVELLSNSEVNKHLTGTITVTIIATILVIGLGIFATKKNTASTKI